MEDENVHDQIDRSISVIIHGLVADLKELVGVVGNVVLRTELCGGMVFRGCVLKKKEKKKSKIVSKPGTLRLLLWYVVDFSFLSVEKYLFKFS